MRLESYLARRECFQLTKPIMMTARVKFCFNVAGSPSGYRTISTLTRDVGSPTEILQP